jgi:hypothetical protein
MLHSQPNAQITCPCCHEDIGDDQPKLFAAEQAFHFSCWMRSILGPKYRAHEMAVQQKVDRAALPMEQKRGA